MYRNQLNPYTTLAITPYQNFYIIINTADTNLRLEMFASSVIIRI